MPYEKFDDDTCIPLRSVSAGRWQVSRIGSQLRSQRGSLPAGPALQNRQQNLPAASGLLWPPVPLLLGWDKSRKLNKNQIVSIVEQIGTARVVSLTEIRMGLSFRIYHTFGGASQNQHRCLRSANAQITTMIAA